jgi:hypothetical protein
MSLPPVVSNWPIEPVGTVGTVRRVTPPVQVPISLVDGRVEGIVDTLDTEATAFVLLFTIVFLSRLSPGSPVVSVPTNELKFCRFTKPVLTF